MCECVCVDEERVDKYSSSSGLLRERARKVKRQGETKLQAISAEKLYVVLFVDKQDGGSYRCG